MALSQKSAKKQEEQKMKLAFSTVGCPDFQWSEIYAMAKDLWL